MSPGLGELQKMARRYAALRERYTLMLDACPDPDDVEQYAKSLEELRYMMLSLGASLASAVLVIHAYAAERETA